MSSDVADICHLLFKYGRKMNSPIQIPEPHMRDARDGLSFKTERTQGSIFIHG